MDVDNGQYTYTDKNRKKQQVPIQRVYSLSQLHSGDHIAFKRFLYWHHAIVEYVDTQRGEANVIEYSNTVQGFSQDNSSYPKNPGMAKVKRGRNKLGNDDVYLIKYKKCLDAETAISRARSRLGERKYDPLDRNCEHFVVWCKIGVASSEQGDNAKRGIVAVGFVALVLAVF